MSKAEYARKYYLAHRDQALAYARRLAQRNAIDVRALKLLRGCIDCGYDLNADALEFDHVRGVKRGNVASMVMSLSILIDEIAKCEVVCSNCHSIRTNERHRTNKKMAIQGV